MKVVIAGGGTAGHVIPAVALAKALDGHEVTFLGTARGAEATLVPNAGFPLETVDVRGFDRSRPLSVVSTGARAVMAVRGSRRMLHKIRPDVVVGMGGYVSLPVCVAARSRGIPIVLHEQNMVLGLANRCSKPMASKVGVSFEDTLEAVGSKGVLVGNPVLPEVADHDREEERARGIERFGLDPGRRTLLVFGGSQGAEALNDIALGLVAAWTDRSDLQLLHVAGRRAYARLSAAPPQPASLVYKVVDYVDRMTEAYCVADLALCRGGATTVAELTVVGLPSIIVPYPHHRDRQQELHGRWLERSGAAVMLAQNEATVERVASAADGPLTDGARLEAMRSAARGLGRPDAAERLAELVRAA